MNAFEFNKIAGAVLSALLLIFGGKTIWRSHEGSHAPQKAAYTLPMPKGGAGGPAADAAPFDVGQSGRTSAQGQRRGRQGRVQEVHGLPHAGKGRTQPGRPQSLRRRRA